MAIDNEVSDIIFIEAPVIKRYMNATISEIGMVRITIKVALHLPRKNNTTSTTKIAA